MCQILTNTELKDSASKLSGERGTLRFGGFKADFNATKINPMVRNSLKIKQLLTSMFYRFCNHTLHSAVWCLHQLCTSGAPTEFKHPDHLQVMYLVLH